MILYKLKGSELLLTEELRLSYRFVCFEILRNYFSIDLGRSIVL